MHHISSLASRSSLGRLTAIALVAASLAACGGGGGSPGTVGSGSGSGTGTGTGTGTGGTTLVPKVTLALTDGAGANITSLSGGQSASVKATLLDSAGKPVAGAIVQFTTSELVVFTPATGSALTDANGVATVSVKPASTTSAGAVAITASSVVAGTTATASTNLSVGAAPLTVGSLSFAQTLPTSLPAFSTLSLNIPVTSGGQPASTVEGLNMTSLCAGDGTATLVAGAFANGVQTATYTNNGCRRVNDTITVTIGNSSQSIGVAVSPANIGSIQFSGSSMSGTSIVLKGSGGQGRSEAAQLTFRVVDQNDKGLAGVDVDFAATTYTGGLTVSPTRATTDASGNVMTMVSSGTIPTPVRVTAEASRNGMRVSGLSDALTISTGLPIQKSMSMSAEKYNIEGRDYDNETTNITVLLADQYGNPVSDGSTVNFVTEGGAVGSSAQGACQTANGGCTVSLRSQNFRPLDGRVTVLAYLQGIENFVDSNGDGQYSCSGYTGSTPYRPLVDTCPPDTGERFPLPATGQSGDMGDAFLDTDMNGEYDAAKGDLPFLYNQSTYSKNGNGKWGLNYIRSSLEIVFSGSVATLVRQVCSSDGTCRDWLASDGDPLVINGVAGPSCSAQQLRFRLYDVNRNPMPYGTTVASTDATELSTTSFVPGTVASYNTLGGTIHQATVRPDAECAAGSFILRVTTPRGNVTAYTFKSG